MDWPALHRFADAIGPDGRDRLPRILLFELDREVLKQLAVASLVKPKLQPMLRTSPVRRIHR